jgi:disulfide oxidoreductase YuzD
MFDVVAVVHKCIKILTVQDQLDWLNDAVKNKYKMSSHQYHILSTYLLLNPVQGHYQNNHYMFLQNTAKVQGGMDYLDPTAPHCWSHTSL